VIELNDHDVCMVESVVMRDEKKDGQDLADGEPVVDDRAFVEEHVVYEHAVEKELMTEKIMVQHVMEEHENIVKPMIDDEPMIEEETTMIGFDAHIVDGYDDGKYDDLDRALFGGGDV
jgi:hypothetical protein